MYDKKLIDQASCSSSNRLSTVANKKLHTQKNYINSRNTTSISIYELLNILSNSYSEISSSKFNTAITFNSLRNLLTKSKDYHYNELIIKILSNLLQSKIS